MKLTFKLKPDSIMKLTWEIIQTDFQQLSCIWIEVVESHSVVFTSFQLFPQVNCFQIKRDLFLYISDELYFKELIFNQIWCQSDILHFFSFFKSFFVFLFLIKPFLFHYFGYFFNVHFIDLRLKFRDLSFLRQRSSFKLSPRIF